MNIFIKIKNSIYSPKYYSEIMEKPFSYFFKYFLVFALLFALVFSIIVTIKFIPAVKMLAEKAPQLANYFPEELNIVIKDGKASSNVKEPYFIKIPQDWKDSYEKNPGINKSLENLVVIDTKNKFDVATFTSYKTAMLLTSDSMVYYSKDQIAINSLANIKDFILNRSTVAGFIDKIRPFFFVMTPFIIFGIYLAGFASVIFKMFYLLFGALLIWVVSKTSGLNLGYKKSYKLGMPLMTGAIIVTSILGLISSNLTFPFLFSIILIVSAMVNLKKGSISAVAPTSSL